MALVFNAKRQEVVRLLGKEAIRELNQTNWFLEFVSLVAPFLLFLAFAYYLGAYPLSILWFVIFFLQGMVLQWFGYLTHDAAVHREVLGKRGSYLLSLTMIPLAIQPTVFKLFHLCHHDYINTEHDSELNKLNINSWWKRLFMLTIFGQFFVKFFPSTSGGKQYNLRGDKRYNAEVGRTIIRELQLTLLFFSVILISLFFSNTVLYGYFLPFILAVPFWSMTRLIIEHGTVNPDNSLDCATYYRTNVISAWMFFCSSGDCHLIHHLFPKIPSYKVRKALKMIHPILIKEGVVERRSLLKLYYYYFIKNAPYRTKWY